MEKSKKKFIIIFSSIAIVQLIALAIPSMLSSIDRKPSLVTFSYSQKCDTIEEYHSYFMQYNNEAIKMYYIQEMEFYIQFENIFVVFYKENKNGNHFYEESMLGYYCAIQTNDDEFSTFDSNNHYYLGDYEGTSLKKRFESDKYLYIRLLYKDYTDERKVFFGDKQLVEQIKINSFTNEPYLLCYTIYYDVWNSNFPKTVWE